MEMLLRKAVSSSLLTSRKWRQADDEAKVLFIHLLVASDSHGGIESDPDLLADLLFPGHATWDAEKIERCLQKLAAIDLIEPYHADDTYWVQVVNHDAHQPYEFLRKRRARTSPVPSDVRSTETGVSVPVTERALPRVRGRVNRLSPLIERDSNESLLSDSAETGDCSATFSAGQVRAVFDHWEKKDDRPNKRPSKLTADRKSKIEARLREGYSVSQLCYALDGGINDDWHRGENDRNTRYTDIPTLLKSAAKVDALIAMRDTQVARTNGRSTNGVYASNAIQV